MMARYTESQCYNPESQPQESTATPGKSAGNDPSVYIVLLNWNGWRDTLECLHSLSKTDYRNWHLVIVDNGSTDDSVKQIHNARPDVALIENQKNLGFAAGNNVGIRFALGHGADYVFVLNNDTIVFSNTVSQLVGFAEKHPTAALMSPRIDRRKPQREWPIRRRLDFLTLLCGFTALRRIIARIPIISTWLYYTGEQPSVVHFLPGSALFFRATAFETVGLFDERTFLDFEELIIAERVRKAGMCTYFIPQALVHHKGSASGSKLQAKRYIENAKSEDYFLSHYGSLSRLSRWAVKLIRLGAFSVRALYYRNYREHFGEFVEVLMANHSGNPK
jgi:GT2 family glycosyltransferase